MTRWHRRDHRLPLLLAVLLLHALVLWWWPRAAPVLRGGPPAPAVAVRLLPWLVPPPAPKPTPAATPPAPAPARPAMQRVARMPSARSITAAPAGPAASSPAPVEAPAPSVADTAAQPGAERPLDPELSTRAIREIARRPGLAAQAGRAGPPEPSAQQRLGEGIAQGARGDCLKGEYFGAGGGLLSLPFLAAAALADRCRH